MIPPMHESKANITLQKKGLSWHAVGKILAWVTPFVIAGVLAYFHTQFPSHQEFDALNGTVRDHISEYKVRIGSLEEFRVRSEAQQSAINETLQSIIREQASQRAVLEALRSGQDRIFNRLDTLSDRSLTKVENK